MAWKSKEAKRAYERWYYANNRDKINRIVKRYRSKNPDKQKRWQIKKLYGLTPEQYDALLAKQRYSCAICRKPFPNPRQTHVDHCHVGNYVRGLLCFKCNAGIALLCHSPSIAIEAAHYLQKGDLFNAQAGG